MHHDKQDKQNKPQQGDQRQANQGQMNQGRDRDMGNQRNDEEAGKPVQLDKDGKEQGGQHQGGQQPPGGQPRRPETEHRPEQTPGQRKP
jgi:hypothetical protein